MATSNVESLANNVIVTVCTESQPNRFTKVCDTVPVSAGLHEVATSNVESDGINVVIQPTNESQSSLVQGFVSSQTKAVNTHIPDTQESFVHRFPSLQETTV